MNDNAVTWDTINPDRLDRMTVSQRAALAADDIARCVNDGQTVYLGLRWGRGGLIRGNTITIRYPHSDGWIVSRVHGYGYDMRSAALRPLLARMLPEDAPDGYDAQTLMRRAGYECRVIYHTPDVNVWAISKM